MLNEIFRCREIVLTFEFYCLIKSQIRIGTEKKIYIQKASFKILDLLRSLFNIIRGI